MLSKKKAREGGPSSDQGEQADEKGRRDSHLNDDAVSDKISR